MDNQKVISLLQLPQALTPQRKKQAKIVLSHGVFDLLHVGHVKLLAEAKKLGDILIVGIEHDLNVKKIKNPNRPIHNHDARMYILSYLEPVDYVFLIPPYNNTTMKDFYCNIYQAIVPDIIVTSTKASESGENIKIGAFQIGAQFADIDTQCDVHTTHIIQSLQNSGNTL